MEIPKFCPEEFKKQPIEPKKEKSLFSPEEKIEKAGFDSSTALKKKKLC